MDVIGTGWWGADLMAVRVGGSANLLRNDNGPSTATDRAGLAKYIVDSGTSNLLLRRPTFEAVVSALSRALGAEAPPLGHGEAAARP